MKAHSTLQVSWSSGTPHTSRLIVFVSAARSIEKKGRVPKRGGIHSRRGGTPTPVVGRLVAEDSTSQQWQSWSVELVQQDSTPGDCHHEGCGWPFDLAPGAPNPVDVGGVQR